MGYLLFTLISIALLVGFFALTWYETVQGVRFFGERRERLDREVERLTFIVTHVDFGSFLREEFVRGSTRAGHSVVHLSLQVVRAIERLLTRVVKYLRTEHSVAIGPRENTRDFVRKLSDFKDRLKDTRPDTSELQ